MGRREFATMAPLSGVQALSWGLVLCTLCMQDTEGLPFLSEEAGADGMARFNVLLQEEAQNGRVQLTSPGGPCRDRYELSACIGATQSDGCNLPAVRQRCAATCGLCGDLGETNEPTVDQPEPEAAQKPVQAEDELPEAEPEVVKDPVQAAVDKEAEPEVAKDPVQAEIDKEVAVEEESEKKAEAADVPIEDQIEKEEEAEKGEIHDKDMVNELNKEKSAEVSNDQAEHVESVVSNEIETAIESEEKVEQADKMKADKTDSSEVETLKKELT